MGKQTWLQKSYIFTHIIKIICYYYFYGYFGKGAWRMGRGPRQILLKKMKESENGEEIMLWIEIYWVARQNGTLNNFGENQNHQKNSCFVELEKFG